MVISSYRLRQACLSTPNIGPVLANYGVDDLRFAKPVNYGDTLKVRLTCKQKTLA